MAPMTATRRSELIAARRSNPEAEARLRAVVGEMVNGNTYTVQTERNRRRRTVTGVLTCLSDDYLVFTSDGGRTNRLPIEDIVLITAPKEQP